MTTQSAARSLVDDLVINLGEVVDVKTFHAFCNGILHEVQSKVDIRGIILF